MCMKKIMVRAVKGRLVRDPVTKAIISSTSFVQKECDSFWVKRIMQGDVELKAEETSAKADAVYSDSRKQDVKENLREKKDGNIQ